MLQAGLHVGSMQLRKNPGSHWSEKHVHVSKPWGCSCASVKVRVHRVRVHYRVLEALDGWRYMALPLRFRVKSWVVASIVLLILFGK